MRSGSFARVGVTPFAWGALPRVSPREVTLVRAIRARFSGVSSTAVAAVLSDLVGHAVVVDVRRRDMIDSARADLGAQGVVTILAGGGCIVALEVEAELALAIVGSLAGGRTLPKVARARGVEPEVAGALAGVVQYVARACECDLLTIAAIDATTGQARQRFGGVDAIAVEVAVRIGALRTHARLVVGADVSPETRRISPSSSVLRALDDVPLTLHVVVGAGHARRREMVLDVGDVVIVDGLCREGSCTLAAAGAMVGVESTRVASGGVRIGVRRSELAPEPPSSETMPSREDAAMSERSNHTGETLEFPAMDEGSPLADALAEMPVVVRVEAGSVTLSAREWAALHPGDVVTLDRNVGEAFTLRVSGRVIGRGELVEVDGALGVRILERVK